MFYRNFDDRIQRGIPDLTLQGGLEFSEGPTLEPSKLTWIVLYEGSQVPESAPSVE
jgi:hypothetical protein